MRRLAVLLTLLAAPALASSPSEEAGAEPVPEPGTGAALALATGWIVTDATVDAAAGSASLPMTYEVFEATVPHADLSGCPVPLADDGRFCRIGLGAYDLTVFVFSEEGDQPLIGVRTWPVETILPYLN